jgi:long-subunit fatty acid transport protein
MKKRELLRPLMVLTASISAGQALANGFGLPDQDAFATARGEAFVATADNASAIYYNPAGITQLSGNNFRGGVYGTYFEPSYRPTNNAPNHGHTYYSSDNLAAIPQFFYTYTAKGAPLSGYEMAAKLSLWLRGTSPDAKTLDMVAGTGKLDTADGAATLAQTMLSELTVA